MDGVRPVRLTTERLVLREWRDADSDAYAAMCADPRVMEHLVSVLDRDEAAAQIASFVAEQAERGYSPFAAELVETGTLIGFIGLHDGSGALGRPAVEVGWRLAAEHWGRGYAPEGARACLELGFDELGLDEIVSFTVPANRRSWRVMEKIGMSLAGEFDHPKLGSDSPLRHHLLYRLTADEWRERMR